MNYSSSVGNVSRTLRSNAFGGIGPDNQITGERRSFPPVSSYEADAFQHHVAPLFHPTYSKYNDGITAHWGVEDISPVAETIQWPITVMVIFIQKKRGQNDSQSLADTNI